MSHYDPLTTSESLRTVGDFEPTPVAMETTRATGYGSMARSDGGERAGTIYIGSTGRHRARIDDTVRGLYGIYGWSFLGMGLCETFVISLALTVRIPAWIIVALAVVPTVGLVVLSAYTAIVVRRRKCECGGWREG